MQEWINSLFKGVNERLTSPLYGALLVAAIIWNYDIFLTIFFVDNEAILKVTGDKFMKATYIHDYLFTNVPVVWDYFYQNLPYLYSWFYRIIPVFILTWIFITQIPKIANKVHKIERGFMKTREEKNIDYEEDIAEYRLENSKKQDELLQKQKKDAEIQANIIKLQESSFNKKRELSQKQDVTDINRGDNVMTDAEKKNYEKIIGSEKTRNRLTNAIKLVDLNNENLDTVNDSLGIDGKAAEEFSGLYDWKVLGKNLRKDLETGEYRHYFYLEEFGKKVLLQMVKDGYIKQEDLEGKI